MELNTAKTGSRDDRRLHQRRRFPRAAVRWPVTLISKNQTLQGIVKNISQGGVLVYLPETLKPQDTIRLAIEISDCSSVLTAEGEVISVTPLKNLVEKKYAYSVAVQFTNISNEDLKYFSGNLAPEWYSDTIRPASSVRPKEPEENREAIFPLNQQFRKPALWAGSAICIFLLSFYLFSGRSAEVEETETSELASLAESINGQQLQIASLQESNQTLTEIEGQIELVNQQMWSFQEKLSSLSTSMEKLQKEIQNRPVVNTQEDSDLQQNKKTAPAEPVYYEVKKGENLYRISQINGISIAELRVLNNLSTANTIYPGQKLKIR